MKVAIDISPLKNANRYRGVGTYTNQLVESLKSLNISNFSFQLIEGGGITKDCDLIHYPFFDPFFLTLPLKKTKPTVITIHDVIPLVFPEHFPAGIRGTIKFQIQKFSLRNVKAIITDSENSKNDLFKYLNYPKEKIFVVPLAPAEDFKVIKDKNLLKKIKERCQLPENFILYVGDVNYNKNIPGLIRAFKLISTSEVGLVLVGKAFLDENLKETKAILQSIKNLSLRSRTLFLTDARNNSLKFDKEVIRLGWVPQEDLVGIYNLATVYCQPSFYEGFGLPVLEAMACGCPVVAANTSSLPEICGKAAVRIDPYDINNMAEGIRKVIGDKVIRDTLRKNGLGWVKNFSWDKVVRKTYEVYQKVV